MPARIPRVRSFIGLALWASVKNDLKSPLKETILSLDYLCKTAAGRSCLATKIKNPQPISIHVLLVAVLLCTLLSAST